MLVELNEKEYEALKKALNEATVNKGKPIIMLNGLKNVLMKLMTLFRN